MKTFPELVHFFESEVERLSEELRRSPSPSEVLGKELSQVSEDTIRALVTAYENVGERQLKHAAEMRRYAEQRHGSLS